MNFSGEISGSDVNIESTWYVAYEKPLLKLSESARAKMQESRDYIDSRLNSGEAIYGVNTGFGAFSSTRISETDLIQLQKNLVRSHSSGVGEPFKPAEVRAIMYLRATALATGYSGIRPSVVDKIIEFLNKDITPLIPEQGSVGASGDLAPLAHLALALIGEGEHWDGTAVRPIADVLKEKGVTPIELEHKEGLSLMNGCQVMTAVGLLNSFEARRLIWITDLAGAMSLEALRGSRKAFDPLIPATRRHPGEGQTARNILKLLGPTSSIAESHDQCNRVQDAYSLSCTRSCEGFF